MTDQQKKAVDEAEKNQMSRRDEIAVRLLQGILASQTVMRASGADNTCEGYKYNAINEAIYLTDILIEELDKKGDDTCKL